MRRLFLIASALSLSLSGCMVPSLGGLLGSGATVNAPAPLAATVIDDKALEAAWRSFDVALDAIDLWKAAKPSVKGTPQAIRIANGIDKVSGLLNAAERAAAAGSTTSYATALVEAKAALDELRAALKGN